MAVLLCSTLMASCTGDPQPPMPPYVPPSMPTPEALSKGIKQAVTDAHLIGPIKMSDLRPNDHGVGHFMLCIGAYRTDRRTGDRRWSYHRCQCARQPDECNSQAPERASGPKPTANATSFRPVRPCEVVAFHGLTPFVSPARGLSSV